MDIRKFSYLAAAATLALVSPTPSHAWAAEPASGSSASDRPASIGAEALKAAAGDSEVRAFYEANGWQPVWTNRQAAALEEALSGRAAHGLDRIGFLADDAANGDAAALEVARTKAALAFAGALAQGKVDPKSRHDIYTIPRPQTDVAAGLADAVGAGRVGEWLASLAPQDDRYQRLSKAYLSFRDQAQDASRSRIPASGLIRAGDSDARVPEIARQLQAHGYLKTSGDNASAADGETAVFTDAMAAALEDLQRDYGISSDGIVGPDTIEVLNLSPATKARSLAVALERRRWLHRSPPATRIDVNTAAAELLYYRDGKVVDRRKVIVGEPDKNTPLMSPIYRLVANPTWTVPKSIQNGELADVGSDYLESHNMVMRDGWIVQQPGPDNALGQVKFDMRNQHAIYLHDTSSPSLFERSERHLSHGCVRVEDALAFARMIAEQEGISQEWSKARESGDETFVDLPNEIPVRLLYRNVFVDEQGDIAFRTDPYAWNAPIAKALGFMPGSSRTARSKAADIAP